MWDLLVFAFWPSTPEVQIFVGLILAATVGTVVVRIWAYKRAHQEAAEIQKTLDLAGTYPNALFAALQQLRHRRLARRLVLQINAPDPYNPPFLRAPPDGAFRSALESLPDRAFALAPLVRLAPGIILTFGLMATFIFLGSGLNASAAGLSGDAMARNGGIQGLLQAAGGKFSTSIWGLFCYIGLTIFAPCLDRPVSQYRTIANRLLETFEIRDGAWQAAETARVQRDMLAALQAQKGDMAEVMRGLGETLRDMLAEARQQDADALKHTLEEIRSLLESATRDLGANTSEEIRKTLEKMSERLEASLDRTNGDLKAALEGLAPALQNLVGGSTDAIRKGLLPAIEDAVSQIRDAATAMQAAIQTAGQSAGEQTEKTLREMSEGMKGMLAGAAGEIANMAAANTQASAAAIQPLVDAAKDASDQIRAAAETMTQALDVARASATDTVKGHLEEIRHTAEAILNEIADGLSRANADERQRAIDAFAPAIKTLQDLAKPLQDLERAISGAAGRLDAAAASIETHAEAAGNRLEKASQTVHVSLSKAGLDAAAALTGGATAAKDMLETSSLEASERVQAASLALKDALEQLQRIVQISVAEIGRTAAGVGQAIYAEGGRVVAAIGETGDAEAKAMAGHALATRESITAASIKVAQAADSVAASMAALQKTLDGVETLPAKVIKDVTAVAKDLADALVGIPVQMQEAVDDLVKAVDPIRDFAADPKGLTPIADAQRTLAEAATTLKEQLSTLGTLASDAAEMKKIVSSIQGIDAVLAKALKDLLDAQTTSDKARNEAFLDAIGKFRAVLQDLLSAGEILSDMRYDGNRG